MTDSYTSVYWKVQSKQVGSAAVINERDWHPYARVILPQMYVTLHITTALAVAILSSSSSISTMVSIQV